MNNVLPFPASTTFTAKQALESALDLANNDNLQDVLIAGYNRTGDLVVRSSRMSRQDALWLAEQIRRYAIGEVVQP